MQNKIRQLLIITYFFLVSLYSVAQTFNFKNYSVLDGLPQSYVYTIVQGNKGKLYIGTGEGLTRFDGKNFSNYTIADGLSENFITTSLKDHEGNLWFGHYEGGLTMYDGNIFKKIPTKSTIQSPINCLFQDKKGIIWIGSQSNGIGKIEKGKMENFKDPFSSSVVYSINTDDRQNLFVGTSDGLFICQVTDNKLKIVKHVLKDVAVQQILPLKNEHAFLLATKESGLYKYTPHLRPVLQEIYGEENLSNKNINILTQDPDLGLWMSFYGEGLSKYKLSGNKIINQETYNINSGLSNNYVKSFFIDREENIWIGTFGGGLDHLLNPIFTLYTSQDGLLSNNVSALYNDKNDNIWLGSDKGLNKLSFHNPKEKKIINKYSFPSQLSHEKINSIQEDEKGNILFSTAEKGIWVFDTQSSKFSQWLKISNNLRDKKINQIIRDKNNNLWIATEEGAFQYNPHAKAMQQFSMEEGLVHNNIYSIFIDSQNTVWFATHGTGLSSYKDGKIINYKSPNVASGLDINCFTEDHLGNLWIGTYGQGVYLFDGKDFTKKYSSSEGLGSNYCYSITKDLKNNIWIGHKSGISKFNIVKNTFFHYNKKEGFLVEEVNNNAIVSDEIGNVWFGTVGGLLRYNIKVDKPHLAGPIVQLKEIKLFLEDVDWTKYSDSLVGLDSLPANLILSYNENHLTFNVIGVSLANPEKIKYQYKLEGFENKWSLITNEGFITYANLPPGTYTFKARAQNSFGVWSESPTSFQFTIQNPFWKTWWFITLSVIASIALIVLIIHIRTQALQKQQQILQNEKIKLEAEIKERKLAEKRQLASEKKLKQTNEELNTFIYRSSHDLRGPLSTVKGLTQLGIMEVKEPAALKYFNLISDRINRLDTILKALINIVEILESDIDSSLINFNEMIMQVLADLGNYHIHKSVDIKITIDNKVEFFSDYKLIYNILKNIIDNAIMYKSPDRDDSFLEINISDIKDGIKMSFTDNGIGISEDVKHKVFDMFFRGTDKSKGSGLGLYITKKVINNKLNGSLRLESEYLKGTHIECYLPSFGKTTVHPHN